jgi:hypothetical protein
MSSYFEKSRKGRKKSTDQSTSETTSSRKTGDLDGDGDVDWVDSFLGVVSFIQTPRGQTFVIVCAAVLSAIVNFGSYYSASTWLIKFLGVPWLLPFGFLFALVSWALLQVAETLPRISLWDWETKVQITKSLQGMSFPLVKYDETKGMQTDLPFWQEMITTEAQQARMMLWAISAVAHLVDGSVLWQTFPWWTAAGAMIVNIAGFLFLMFSFEGLVGIAQKLKQLRSGFQIQT